LEHNFSFKYSLQEIIHLALTFVKVETNEPIILYLCHVCMTIKP